MNDEIRTLDDFRAGQCFFLPSTDMNRKLEKVTRFPTPASFLTRSSRKTTLEAHPTNTVKMASGTRQPTLLAKVWSVNVVDGCRIFSVSVKLD